MTLPAIDRHLESLLAAATPLDDPAWFAALTQRHAILAALPQDSSTLTALEQSLLSGARLMSLLRAERQVTIEQLEATRQALAVHQGYAAATRPGTRQWSA